MAMGFRRKCMKWTNGGIFSSYISVLVNGSPTKDFKVFKVLRHGDPLSPFLFSIVAEGFVALVRRFVNSDILRGFKINDEVSYSLL